mmetsp:Transcript_34736/g.111582  ORF Transcript_34736/g.111582 Transcript_34736/m.111582 type:complete len:294 (-) Transcript_34736:484-1365(-)
MATAQGRTGRRWQRGPPALPRPWDGGSTLAPGAGALGRRPPVPRRLDARSASRRGAGCEKPERAGRVEQRRRVARQHASRSAARRSRRRRTARSPSQATGASCGTAAGRGVPSRRGAPPAPRARRQPRCREVRQTKSRGGEASQPERHRRPARRGCDPRGTRRRPALRPRRRAIRRGRCKAGRRGWRWTAGRPAGRTRRGRCLARPAGSTRHALMAAAGLEASPDAPSASDPAETTLAAMEAPQRRAPQPPRSLGCRGAAMRRAVSALAGSARGSSLGPGPARPPSCRARGAI